MGVEKISRANDISPPFYLSITFIHRGRAVTFQQHDTDMNNELVLKLNFG